MFDRNLISLPGSRKAIFVASALLLFRVAFTICQCFALSYAIVLVWRGNPIAESISYLALFAISFMARQILKALQEAYMDRYALKLEGNLRERLCDSVWDSGDALLTEEGSAALSSMMVDQISKIGSYASDSLPKTIGVIVMPVGIAIAIFTQDWVSGLIVSICYPFIIVFMRLIGHSASDESAKRLKGFSVMSDNFLDSLRGMETLKAFKVSKAFSDNVYKASEAYRKMVMKTLRIATLSSTVLDIFATCGLAAVAIMLGFRMVDGDMEFLPALTVLMLVPEFFMPVKAYASDYHATLDGRSALEKLLSMLDAKKRIVEVSEIEIPKGSSVALVGRTGSGKTSLLSAIAGTAEHGDAVLHVAGIEPSSDPEWQGRVASIPQRPHIIEGTLRENIAFYNPDASDQLVLDALDMAGLREFASSLPDGLDTRIALHAEMMADDVQMQTYASGDGLRGVSGGQAQRIAIARAMADPSRDIWLLDEPGSNLDRWTEEELKRSVLSISAGKTLIVATHRLHWIPDMDAVIDMDSAEGD